jgi:hypothetical protein
MKSLPRFLAAALFSLSLIDAPVHAQDTFSAEETVVQKVTPEEAKTDSRRVLKFSLDESRVIYDAPLTSAPAQWWFFLPPEANSVVQLIIQKHEGRRLFILKAIGRGKTVGGFVHRDWLDDDGFAPKSPLDETKVQHAVKSQPIYIIVD